MTCAIAAEEAFAGARVRCATGFDISFHPLPWDVLTERVYPYVLGEAPSDALDPLVSDAVRIAKVRFRANAWGLGVLRLRDAAPAAFDPDLHVWGRPFFVTAEGTEAIADTIDRDLAARPEDVDAIAREQLEQLQPGLASRVEPSDEGTLPSDADLAASVRGHVDLMRASVAAIRGGRGSIEFGGRAHDPARLLGRELALTALTFAADFRPGWMARGKLWPSLLLVELGVNVRDRIIANAAMFMPVYRALPDVPWFLAETIYENYQVGGAASPGDLPALRALLMENRERILAPARAHGEHAYVATVLRKIDEAMADAQHRGLPFCEATEVYSGFSGIMN